MTKKEILVNYASRGPNLRKARMCGNCMERHRDRSASCTKFPDLVIDAEMVCDHHRFG